LSEAEGFEVRMGSIQVFDEGQSRQTQATIVAEDAVMCW